jgi:beta-lactam-binding protein with PASTA domain
MRLRGTNCLLGKVSKKKSRSRRGTVVAQRPGARRQVTAGTRIDLVLSRGR